MKSVNIKEIPTREIWAVGNSFLSRTTAMLQYIIKDLAIAYCSKEIDEYCRDSSHYLETLHKWKQSKHEEHKENIINDEILFHTIGKRKNKNDNLTKISGPNAKFFKNTKPGYIYLIFKT